MATSKRDYRNLRNGLMKLVDGFVRTVKAPAGEVVGTFDRQKLTNKTMDGRFNKFSNLPEQTVEILIDHNEEFVAAEEGLGLIRTDSDL